MKKLKTVILEDDIVARLMLEHYCLNHPDLDFIISFDDIEEAISFLKKDSADLILLDIQLKNSNGFDLLPFVSETSQVIVTTGNVANAEKAKELNISQVLLKPIKLEDFLQAIEIIKRATEHGGIH